MQDSSAPDIRAGLIVNTVKHRVVVIVVCGLLGLATGFAFSQLRTAAYTSSTSVLIQPVEGNPYAPEAQGDDLVSLETEAQIVGSDPVTNAVAERLSGRLSQDALQRGVSVVVPPNTQIIQISFTAADAALARDAAQAFALAYLDYRLEQADDVIAAEISSIDKQIDRVVGDIRAATAAMETEDEAERRFQREYALSLNSELLDLRAQRFGAQQVPARPGRVISPAEAPQQTAGLSVPVLGAAGLIAGLVAGLAIGLTRERAADRIYSTRDLTAAGVRAVAKIPSPRPFGRRDEFIVEEGDAVRHIRSAVMSTSNASVVAVTGCSPGAPEAGVAARLALSLWRVGADVVLVDGVDEPTDPSGIIRTIDGPGLSEAVLEDVPDVLEMLVALSDDRLRLLPRGRRLSEAAEHLMPRNLRPVVGPISHDTDYVVLRAPSIHQPGGEAMMQVAGATLLVVTPGRTTYEELRSGAVAVEEAGRTLIGAVLAPTKSGQRRVARQAVGHRRLRPAEAASTRTIATTQ